MVLKLTPLQKFNTIYIYEYGCLSCLCFNWFHIWILRELGILKFAIPTYLDCIANYRVLLSNVGPRPPFTATKCNESTLMGLFGSHLVSHFISWLVMKINVILYNIYARYYTIIALYEVDTWLYRPNRSISTEDVVQGRYNSVGRYKLHIDLIQKLQLLYY